MSLLPTPPSPVNVLKRRTRRIHAELTKLYPQVHTELDYTTPLQLVVATILSAQCTDKKINQITPALFARYPDAKAFAEANVKELRKMIHESGFFRAKARNIMACCKGLVEKHGGEVPRTMEELIQLAGIGRKTANVILGNAFGIPGLPVDTHVRRLSQRMGLTVLDDPVKIERELNELVPVKDWTDFSHRVIYHGRRVCFARKPRCSQCVVAQICPKVGVTNAG